MAPLQNCKLNTNLYQVAVDDEVYENKGTQPQGDLLVNSENPMFSYYSSCNTGTGNEIYPPVGSPVVTFCSSADSSDCRDVSRDTTAWEQTNVGKSLKLKRCGTYKFSHNVVSAACAQFWLRAGLHT
jgi:hypothetical protein